MNASPVLGLVYYSAVKCLIAAQDIVKTLNAFHAHMKNEHDKCELLEYLYAATLILIAARTAPLLMNGNVRGTSATTITARSLTTMSEDLDFDATNMARVSNVVGLILVPEGYSISRVPIRGGNSHSELLAFLAAC